MKLKLSTGQWIASFILLSTTTWMVSGKGSPDAVALFKENQHIQQEPFKVAVFDSVAEPIQPLIETNGITATPHQQPIVVALETKLNEILVKAGDHVKPGQVLVTADLTLENHKTAKTAAILEQRRLEYKSAQSLLKKNLLSEQQLAEALSQLKVAEQAAGLAARSYRLSFIRSYVHGIVEHIEAYNNQLIPSGTVLGNIVETSVIVVKGSLAEITVNKVQVGDRANIQLKSGEKLSGRIRFISPISHSETHTFDFEVEIPHSENHPDSIYGMTATIQILQPFILAHFISPALLQLDDQGTMGIKTVNDDGLVEFEAVTIVDSNIDGIWVSGLAKNERVIAQGFGFVNHGDQVESIYEQESISSTPPKHSASDHPITATIN